MKISSSQVAPGLIWLHEEVSQSKPVENAVSHLQYFLGWLLVASHQPTALGVRVLIKVSASPHHGKVVVVCVENRHCRVVVQEAQKVGQKELGDSLVANVEEASIVSVG